MDLMLKDKVAWVTGASGGIGRSIALHLAAEGALLAVHGNRSADTLRAWLAEQDFKDRAIAVEADVRDPNQLASCADAIVARFGRIDVCVANAGVWPQGDHALDEFTVSRLRDTIDVNLVGSLLTARVFMAALRAAGPRADGHGAALTFIGSTAGRFGERGHADYAASKAGLIGAMLSLKNEVVRIDPYARVNVVEPGWTVTHMAKPALDVEGAVEGATRTMALRQLGRAADIARTVTWLSSPYAASHVTGQVVTVAGGMEGRSLWSSAELERGSIMARLERD